MKKRKFLKLSAGAAAGILIGSNLVGCNPTGSSNETKSKGKGFEAIQPKLEFDFAALEPHIDARTMEIHYSKHHAGYTRKFNAAIQDSGIGESDLTKLLGSLKADQTGLRNNGGGFFNHNLFWNILGPNSGVPAGKLSDAIAASFGNMDDFKKAFFNAAKGVFGSGWAWLNTDKNGKLFISSTSNQDNPLMNGIVEKRGVPIMGLDVWEHAYYLKYQNKRGDYINNFFNVINWEAVAKNYSEGVG